MSPVPDSCNSSDSWALLGFRILHPNLTLCARKCDSDRKRMVKAMGNRRSKTNPNKKQSPRIALISRIPEGWPACPVWESVKSVKSVVESYPQASVVFFICRSPLSSVPYQWLGLLLRGIRDL